MSNEVNKIYQFLAKFNNWQDYVDENYSHGEADNIVTKYEFKDFINNEWDNKFGTIDDDLINKFWKKIDTNTSSNDIKGSDIKNLNALDKDEAAKLEQKLEVYVALNEFLEKNVKAPNVLTTTAKQWKEDVTSELNKIAEEIISNGGTKQDLEAALTTAFPNIANRNTAEYCVVEYMAQLKNGSLAGLDYDYTSDTALNSLLQEYISAIDPSHTPEEIKTIVHKIIDQYLATAGIGGAGSTGNSGNAGTVNNTQGLTDLQKATLVNKYKNELKDYADKYRDFADEFNKIVEDFVESLVASGKTFEELQNLDVKSEFAKADVLKNLDNYIKAYDTYSNVEAGSALYNSIKREFGGAVADMIVKNGNTGAYGEILKEVLTQVLEGTLDIAEIDTLIVKKLGENLSGLFPNGMSEIPVKDLGIIYDNRIKKAKEEKDSNKQLDLIVTAATDYCDAIDGKGSAYRKLLNDIFGTDWRSAVAKMSVAEIEEKITEIKTKALEIETNLAKINESNIKWKSPDFNKIIAGKSYELDMAIGLPNGVDPSLLDIEYSCSALSGNTGTTISCVDPSTGKFELIAGLNPGTATFTITVNIAGKVFKKEYSITIPETKTSLDSNDWANYSTSEYISYGEYTNNKYNGESTVRDEAIKKVSGTVDDIYSALSGTKKYDQNALDYAYEKTNEFFKLLITNMSAHSGVSNSGSGSGWTGHAKFNLDDKAYDIAYNQESHGGYIDADKNQADKENIEWTRGTMAGARFAKISIRSSYIFEIFNSFYEAYINSNKL